MSPTLPHTPSKSVVPCFPLSNHIKGNQNFIIQYVPTSINSIGSEAAKNGESPVRSLLDYYPLPIAAAPPHAFSISRLLQPGPFEFTAPSIDSFYFAPPPIGNVPEVTKATTGYILFRMCMSRRKLLGLSSPSNHGTAWSALGPVEREKWYRLFWHYSHRFNHYVKEGRIRRALSRLKKEKMNREERRRRRSEKAQNVPESNHFS
ncbi:unnamed protein product [Caenorhabditis sp. 36 PRJEB53466]|nr:unnamed protein product [Caenorhabditis sp. 36 PRJEB53466]